MRLAPKGPYFYSLIPKTLPKKTKGSVPRLNDFAIQHNFPRLDSELILVVGPPFDSHLVLCVRVSCVSLVSCVSWVSCVFCVSRVS